MLIKNTQAGFNIIELMVVMFVAGILMSVGIPAFNGFMANSRMSVAANDIATSLHIARTEAVKRRANVSICPSANWNTNVPTCSNTNLEDGWIIFVDSIAPALADLAHTGAQDILYAHGPLNDDIAMAVADANNPLANTPFLVFGPNGFPQVQMGANEAVFNFEMCDSRGNADTGGGIAAGRWIQVMPTGRPQIYRQQAQVQSAANPSAGC